MKDILTSAFIVVAFFVALYIAMSGPSSTSSVDDHVISYTKDDRSELYFAVYNKGYQYGLTEVDCEKVEPYLKGE